MKLKASKATRVLSLCERAAEERVFPGCVTAWWRDGQAHVVPFGGLTYETGSDRVIAQTIYDVASITKSIPTAAIIMKLVEDGRLELDERVIKYIPELNNSHREDILIRHLLTYTVIFNTGKNLSEVATETPGQILDAIFSAPLLAPPGERYLYTDAPAILMGIVAERVCKKKLDGVADEMIFGPLGMTHTTFHPKALIGSSVAPTEVDSDGEVLAVAHDEKARALEKLGHVSGHAGLFSTAEDLLAFTTMLLDNGKYDGRQVFRPETVERMLTSQTSGLEEDESFGWQMRRGNFMPEVLSSNSIGRTGYPGTVILADPDKRIALVHLSNHTYPKRPAQRAVAINAFRRELAGIIFG